MVGLGVRAAATPSLVRVIENFIFLLIYYFFVCLFCFQKKNLPEISELLRLFRQCTDADKKKCMAYRQTYTQFEFLYTTDRDAAFQEFLESEVEQSTHDDVEEVFFF